MISPKDLGVSEIHYDDEDIAISKLLVPDIDKSIIENHERSDQMGYDCAIIKRKEKIKWSIAKIIGRLYHEAGWDYVYFKNDIFGDNSNYVKFIFSQNKIEFTRKNECKEI